MIKLTKRFIIIAIVLLIGSLAGFLAARPLSETIEQETTLLSYEHKGAFDYLIHLTPSYLFGPEPEEPPPPPPDPQYPTALVDSLSLSFTWQPESELSQGVEISAILENAGIWQKEIVLVPAANRTGGFTLEFPLDLEAIHELYDAIDAEIEIASSARAVTIVATVDDGAAVFQQSLPIRLGKSVIEVGGSLTQAQGGSLGTFDYIIGLKPNSLYDGDTLKPQVVAPFTPPVSTETLGPGDVIFGNLVDAMDASFYYSFRASAQVSSVTSEATLVVVLEAAGSENTTIWSKEFPLLSGQGNGEINLAFPVDVLGYLDLMNTIRQETGTSGEANNVVISAVVHTVAETDYGLIDETFTQDLKGSLGGGILAWDGELTQTQPGTITQTRTMANPEKLLGLSVGAAKMLFTVLLFISILLLLLSVAGYFVFRPESVSPAEREITQARKKYRERLAEATSHTLAPAEKTISLGSLEDLVKVADELGKPVVHQPPSRPEEQHAYYVFDGDIRYQYFVSMAGDEPPGDAGG